MSKTLLIVESPAKAGTIEKLLGPNYIVKSSFGHIRNLSDENMGIDVNNNFRPTYKIMSTRSKQIKDIQDTIKRVQKVLLAADEDREGEAIAWHCAVVFKLDINQENRICFHEITKNALQNAVNNPRKIDMNMVRSQQSRQILDKLVGFEISPVLWKKVGPKLSAGRVQSVALKLILEKEREIEGFQDRRYFKTQGFFKSNIIGILNVEYEDENLIKDFLEKNKNAIYTVEKLEKKRIERRPPPPYTTSTIQQDLGTRFGFSAKMIMSNLQKLYEGGKITYHRTDSTNLSDHILKEIKDFIQNDTNLGPEYFHGRLYRTKQKSAQEAHEAIRPTYINIQHLDDTFTDIEKKIYEIIWKRTVATQMSPCISDVFTLIIGISGYENEKFIAKAERIVFEGYKKIYQDIKKEDEEENNLSPVFGDIKEGDILENEKIISVEKYQNPPGRFSEATLIKKMENIGIGRPSTYASIINTITNERGYVDIKNIIGRKINGQQFTLEEGKIKTHKIEIKIGEEKKKMQPTEIGKRTCGFLMDNFDTIMNYDFTSQMEDKLDKIANGEAVWNEEIGNFYNSFHPKVEELMSNNNNTNTNSNDNDNNSVLNNKIDLGIYEGKKVYIYTCKDGRKVFLMGDRTKKYVNIPEYMDLNNLTMEDFKNALLNPNVYKTIGQYNNIPIYLKKAKTFYLSYNNNNYSLKENMDENLTLDDALQCLNIVVNKTIINDEGEEETVTETNDIVYPFKLGKYTVKNGKFGPYVQLDKINASIPKDTDIKTMTVEKCEFLIENRKNMINNNKNNSNNNSNTPNTTTNETVTTTTAENIDRYLNNTKEIKKVQKRTYTKKK